MFYIIGALFAIVIGVILTINVMGGGRQGSSGSQISTTVNEINQLRTGIKLLGYTNNFSGLDNDVLEVGGVMPPELIAGAVGAGNDVNSWGGQAYVAAAADGGLGDTADGTSHFGIDFNGVPQAACVALASEICSAAGTSEGAVNINAVAVGTAGKPLNPSTAAVSCVVGANALVWFFND